MTRLAKEIDLLEKQVKLLNDNYNLICFIVNDVLSNDNRMNGILERYKLKLIEKNLERSKETKQIDLEDSIAEQKKIKSLGNSYNC